MLLGKGRLECYHDVSLVQGKMNKCMDDWMIGSNFFHTFPTGKLSIALVLYGHRVNPSLQSPPII